MEIFSKEILIPLVIGVSGTLIGAALLHIGKKIPAVASTIAKFSSEQWERRNDYEAFEGVSLLEAAVHYQLVQVRLQSLQTKMILRMFFVGMLLLLRDSEAIADGDLSFLYWMLVGFQLTEIVFELVIYRRMRNTLTESIINSLSENNALKFRAANRLRENAH